MRYILALIPPETHRLAYIQTAKQAFASRNDGYLLRDGISMPHITICSFQCDESKITELLREMQNWSVDSCVVRIMGILFKKGKTPANHYSVGLSIARDPSIVHLHQSAMILLQNYAITPLNPNQDLYQPHLTLAGICWPRHEIITLTSILDDLISMPVEPFQLVLGRGDDIGQYLETLFEFKINKTKKNVSS